jgi:hypothetical protein
MWLLLFPVEVIALFTGLTSGKFLSRILGIILPLEVAEKLMMFVGKIAIFIIPLLAGIVLKFFYGWELSIAITHAVLFGLTWGISYFFAVIYNFHPEQAQKIINVFSN